MQKRDRTWIEISRSNLRHNLMVFRRLLGTTTPIWVVKANAYGHGGTLIAREIQNTVQKGRGEWFAVDAIDEAIGLRVAGITAPIIVIGYVVPERLIDLVRWNCRYLVSSIESVRELARVRGGRTVRLHIKIDTGTSRQGVLPPLLAALVDEVKKRGFVLEGAASHFANIEDTYTFAKKQIKRFSICVAQLRNKGFVVPMTHIACSAAALLHPETQFAGSRVGISLYGIYPSKHVKLTTVKHLKPVLSWRSRAALVKELPPGIAVSYGLTEKTKHTTKLVVIPVGYADGYDRGFSSVGEVLIRGTRCKVLGRICMNLFMVDATKSKGVRQDDTVTLIGVDKKEEITTDELAQKTNTISYEVVARIAQHLPRYVV